MESTKITCVSLLILVSFLCFFPCETFLIAGKECGENQVYDYGEKECAFLPGKECDKESGDKCGKNSQCVEHYFQNINGSCEEQRGFGRECQSDDMCRSDKFLQCIADGYSTKHCKCPEGRVIVQAGLDESCYLQVECDTLKLPECLKTLNCDSINLCACHGPPIFESPEGTCKHRASFGETCDNNVPNSCKISIQYKGHLLDSNLECLEGKCVCSNESIAIQNDDEANNEGMNGFRCVHRLEMDCMRDWDCPLNAGCYLGGSWTKCRCKAGYTAVKDEACEIEIKKGHGEQCKATEDCDKGSKLVCIPESGQCECRENTAYHPVEKRCVWRDTTYCEDEDKRCVPNAQCLTRHPRRCRCESYATPSILNDGYCYTKENEECDTNAESFHKIVTSKTKLCLPGLVCLNHTCSCFYEAHQIYDILREKCYSLVGGPCNETVECMENSECVNEDEMSVCRCKSGFSPVNRRCDLAHGENCTQGDHSLFCDRLAPLGCSLRGKCECLGLQVYEEKSRKCRGLVGAKCKLKEGNGEPFCVDGASCKSFRNDDEDSGICFCRSGWRTQKDKTCHHVGGEDGHLFNFDN